MKLFKSHFIRNLSIDSCVRMGLLRVKYLIYHNEIPHLRKCILRRRDTETFFKSHFIRSLSIDSCVRMGPLQVKYLIYHSEIPRRRDTETFFKSHFIRNLSIDSCVRMGLLQVKYLIYYSEIPHLRKCILRKRHIETFQVSFYKKLKHRLVCQNGSSSSEVSYLSQWDPTFKKMHFEKTRH